MVDAAGQTRGSEGTDRPRRVRKSPERRRSELITVAREVFTTGDIGGGGMSDVAEAAGVSKGLLYHYFPGRGELVDAVAEQLLDELCARISQAGHLPFSPLARLDHVLAALFGFFAEQPLAYRMLVDKQAERSVGEGVRQLARVRLISLMTAQLAGSALPADTLLNGSGELLASVLEQVEACQRGECDPETAWRSSCHEARRILDGR